MKNRKTPYKCHVFVCIKSRNGERKSCGDGDAIAVKSTLKEAVNARGWKNEVRISDSGCLGLCETGPNVMIYPQGIWLAQVKSTDVPEILKIVEESIRQ